MSDKVNFTETLLSMSAPGADYFWAGRDISAHLHRHGVLTELPALNRFELPCGLCQTFHDLEVRLVAGSLDCGLQLRVKTKDI